DPGEFDRVLLIARARTNAKRLLGPMREAARDGDPRVLAQSRLMKMDFEKKLRPHRLASNIFVLTSLLALSLACLGVFGVVSYGASLRTKEIGIRVTLGANRGSMVVMLLRQPAWPAVVGLIAGIAAAVPVATMLEGKPLYLRSVDASVYIAAALV